jgi:hypothetical protein
MSNYTEPYPGYTEVETDQSGRHPVSVGHLVMGVAFVGLATIWLLFESDVVQTGSLRWFLPLPWLAAGVAGLLAVALTGRRTKPQGVYVATPAHSEPEPAWGEPDPLTVERDARLDADIAAAEQDVEKPDARG